MRKVLSFNEFADSFKWKVDEEAKLIEKEVFSAVTIKFQSQIFTSSYLTEAEKEWLENFAKSENIALKDPLTESLWGIIKKGYREVKDSDIGKAVTDKIGKLMDSAKAFSAYIADLFRRGWDKILGYFKKKYEKTKETVIADYKKGKEGAKAGVSNLASELKQLRETMMFWLKEFPEKIINTIKGKFSEELVKECLQYDGDLLLELADFDIHKAAALLESDEDVTVDGEQKGVFSFLNKVSHSIEKFFPFNLLHMIKDVAEVGAKKFLGKFSELTKKLGGPGMFEFAATAAISAAFFETYVKHLAIGGVEEILHGEAVLRFLPGAIHIIHVIEFVAMGVVIIDTVNNIIETEQEIEKKGSTEAAPTN